MKIVKYRIKTSAVTGDWNYLYVPTEGRNKESLTAETKEWIEYLVERDINDNYADVSYLEGYRGYDWELVDDIPDYWIEEQMIVVLRKLKYYKDKLSFLKDRRYFNSIDPVKKLENNS